MDMTQQINAQIAHAGRGREPKDVTRSILDEWRGSQIMQDMAAADEYYGVKNTAITAKSRDYIDANGDTQTNETLSNNRIKSAFLRANVQQKVNYAATKPLIVSVTSPKDGEDANQDLYMQEWTDFLTTDARKPIKRIVANAVNKGIGWAYVTIIDGKLQLFSMEPRQMYPAWGDEAHTTLDAIVRDYVVIAYINNVKEIIRKVEYWDSEVVEFYEEAGGGLRPDTDDAHIDAHMRMGDEGVMWRRVPFIALKGNDDELPMLNIIRAQTDAYDALQSKVTDALLDDVDAVLKVRGITTSMGELARARKMMQQSRIMSVDSDGDAGYIKNEPNIEAAARLLEILKKDIREFGQSVDTQDVRFGSNPSGVALKSMYQDLDVYTNGLESEIDSFIQQLKFFFDAWLELRKIGTAAQWSEYQVSVTLDRDMMINTSADIQETVSLAATGVSQETLDTWNPAVESHEIEQQRRERESEAVRDDTAFAAAVQRSQESGEDDTVVQ